MEVVAAILLLVPIVALIMFALAWVFRYTDTSAQATGARATIRRTRGFADLPARITALPSKPSDGRWFGFTTRGDDCLYFYFDDGRYYLGIERPSGEPDMCDQQFKDLASRLGFKTESCAQNTFAVVRIRIKSDPQQAAELAYRFANELFGTERNARLEFVP